MCTFFSILFITVFTNYGFAQNTEKSDSNRVKTYHKLNVSYIAGGQIYNDNFLYTPGYGLSMSNGFLIKKNLSLGLEVGGQFFEDERFLPISAELTAYQKSKKSKKSKSFINTQLGYSIGWNKAFSNLENYDFKGGLFMNAGFGRRTQINKDLSVVFQLSYRHQFAEIHYNNLNVRDYSTTLNYDMLVLTVSLLLEKQDD